MIKFFFLFIALAAADIAFAQNDGNIISISNANTDTNDTYKVADGIQGTDKLRTSDASDLANGQPSASPGAAYYPSDSICGKSWMTKNLDVSTYKNGDLIPKVTDNAQWATLTTGAYCYYNNDSTTYAATYGKLYNWYAVNDPRGLAPEGWHIPTDLEWTTLSNCLGGDTLAGGPLKEKSFKHWNTPNKGATNLSGLKFLPGGVRGSDDSEEIGEYGFWWSITWSHKWEDLDEAWGRAIGYDRAAIVRQDYPAIMGISVRCVKN